MIQFDKDFFLDGLVQPPTRKNRGKQISHGIPPDLADSRGILDSWNSGGALLGDF